MKISVSPSKLKQYLKQQEELGMPDFIFINKTEKLKSDLPKPIKDDATKTKPVETVYQNSDETSKPEITPEKIPYEKTTPKKSYEEKRKELAQLFYENKSCKGCELCTTRNNIVFGAGNADADIMIIGEGPGQEEDTCGLPFVGAAGQLLDKMINAINLDKKKDLFIANIVKCRPPGNRNPEQREIKACIPILKRQIFIIQPKIILALGKIAIKELLGRDESIASLRLKNGEYFYNGIPLIITYHPAALLRDEKYKRPAWEDLQILQQKIGEMKK